MIRQLIEHGYVARSTRGVTETLARELELARRDNVESRVLLAEHELDPSDLEIALEALTHATHAVEQEPPAAAFLARTPVASLVQSGLQRMYEERLSAFVRRQVPDGAFEADEPVTDQFLTPEAALAIGDQLAGRAEQTDVRWGACLIARGIRAFRGKRPFEDRPAAPMRISNNARLYILGDWGSGVPRARHVGTLIRDMLTAPGMSQREQHVIHLGDVYYSGWQQEYVNNFLGHWPVQWTEADRFGSWCLNANHDMFSGGYGYYGDLLGDPRFRRQQGTSYFSLENDYWQLLGLDTAWEDEDLAGGQPEWIATRLRAAKDKKKSILLSHHQLFSAFDKDLPKIRAKVQGVLDEKLVTGWFWGHEHRCVIYDDRDGVQYGRLVGHSGVPAWADTNPPPKSVRHMLQEYLQSGWEKFNRFGFAVLDFNDRTIDVRYICERGAKQAPYTHYTEKMSG